MVVRQPLEIIPTLFCSTVSPHENRHSDYDTGGWDTSCFFSHGNICVYIYMCMYIVCGIYISYSMLIKNVSMWVILSDVNAHWSRIG